MRIRLIRTFALFTILLSASCQTEMPEYHFDAHRVGFYAGGVNTRTEMLPNGLSAAWEAGDEIAVWAKNSDGTYILNNQAFKTYGLDYERGFFSSELASAMPQDSYTYYCCYPRPLSVSGTDAVFNIPARQDGKVRDGADIMIATPATYGALAPVPDPEDHSGLSMTMNRMMHQFRFYIPASDTKLQGEAVERIKLTFPDEVVGNVTLDLADPSQKAVLSEGSASIDLRLAEPITLAAQNYACVAFCPTAFEAGKSLEVRAYTSDKIVVVDPIDLCARDFQAGHSTPVKLKIKEVKEYPYSIVFKVKANNLGEKPNTITLTAPSECIWTEGGSNVFTYSPGRKIEVGEEIAFRFEDAAAYRAFSGKSIAVTYDSDNALLSSNVSVQNLSSVDNASISLTVPYLFFEDFSGITDFNDGHDGPNTGMASDTYVGITNNLDDLTKESALSGWTGVRVGVSSGALRLCCRYQNVLWKGAYYKGQLYLPSLTNIKDGKDVNISVSFRYDGNSTHSKATPIMYLGVNMLNPLVNPDDADLISGVITGAGYGNKNPSTLSPVAISGQNLSNSGGSYTNIRNTQTVTIENFDNSLRLAWFVTTTDSRGNTNSNSWLYLDDIKIQITK